MHPTPVHRTTGTRIAGLALTATLAGSLVACGSTNAVEGASRGHDHGVAAAAAAEPPVASSAEMRLHTDMRALWAQHMEWTWAAVAAFAEDSDGLSATLDRLLANQADIGDALRPFYGPQAADQLTALLREHIQDAVPVLVAARAGDQAALEEAVAAWYANAEEIGNFLADANPNWARGEMVQMMRMHITQTVGYAAEQLQGHYASSISRYDAAEAHMMDMADRLTAGLVEQFPERFAH